MLVCVCPCVIHVCMYGRICMYIGRSDLLQMGDECVSVRELGIRVWILTSRRGKDTARTEQLDRSLYVLSMSRYR